MKKIIRLLAAGAFATLMAACSSPTPTTIEWVEGPTDPATNKATDILYIINPPKQGGWSVWFCQFKSPVKVLEGSDGDISFHNGSLYRAFPTGSEYKDTVMIKYEFRVLPRQSWAPEGFALQMADGKSANLKTTYRFQPAEDIKTFDYNKVSLGVEDMIPALKSVNHMEGTTASVESYSSEIVSGKKAGWYKITINSDVKVEAADEDGLYYASITLDNIKRNAQGKPVQNMTIEDWPDLPFRGMMLDVSRNFTKKDDVLKLIDALAHYKVNVLHMHLGDDEGWRLAIDGLDELTSYSGFRDLPTIDKDGNAIETKALMPSYSGGSAVDDIPGNGFYTREDYIEILKCANEHHMRVIPEFDTPGHSRAAIKAMEYRYKTTGDASFLLSEAEDESKYESVQYYVDNAINVALPSTYAFIGKVFDSIISMYKEAGAPLQTIHIGGDEVPGGAWVDSPACKKLMADNGWTDTGMLKDYYISKVISIAKSKGLKIAGWQEVTQHLSDDTFALLPEDMEYTNLWNTLPAGRKDELPYTLANKGVNVILSNVTNAYADMAYTNSRVERGHSWGGFIDERRSYSLLPFDLYKSVRWDDYNVLADISGASKGKPTLNPGAENHIIGVQAQLWTETIRNFDHVTYYIFPKMVGVFERGWNAHPVWEKTTVSDDPLFMQSFDKFYTIITEREMPYYKAKGIAYREHK